MSIRTVAVGNVSRWNDEKIIKKIKIKINCYHPRKISDDNSWINMFFSLSIRAAEFNIAIIFVNRNPKQWHLNGKATEMFVQLTIEQS